MPAAPSSAPEGTASPTASPSPSPVVGSLPPLRKPSRIPLYVGVAVVVVVVLLLLVFLLPSNGGAGSGGAQTYSQAQPVASQAASGYQGGGWAPLFAIGFDTATTVTEPLNSTGSGTQNCTLTPAPGVSGNITLPNYTGNRSAGVAPIWEFAYRNGAGSIAIVSVTNGKATVFGTLGGSCTSYFGFLAAIPSNIIDSSAAAAAVEPFAASFLAQYPNASAAFGIIGGASIFGLTIGPEWTVSYSTCAIGTNATTTGTVFNATVNATSGNVIFHQTRTGVTCGSSTVLFARSLGPGIPVAATRT